MALRNHVAELTVGRTQDISEGDNWDVSYRDASALKIQSEPMEIPNIRLPPLQNPRIGGKNRAMFCSDGSYCNAIIKISSFEIS